MVSFMLFVNTYGTYQANANLVNIMLQPYCLRTVFFGAEQLRPSDATFNE